MRVLRNWGLGIGAAVALCVTATVAVGQAPPAPSYPECTKKPTAQDTEGAKGAHKAASQFYERAEYEKAIRYWNDAYAFDCTANDLLLNIANAYEKLGDRASTVATLEAYLKRTGPNPTLEQKVANLKKLAAAPQPTATAAPTTTATAAPTTAPTTAPTAAPTATPEGQRPYGITPWIAVGGGAALAVVGAILLPIGYGAISTANDVCPNHHCPANPTNLPAGMTLQDVIDKGNGGRTQVGVGWGLFSVGIVAAGGGLVWQMLLNKPQQASAPPVKQGAVNDVWVSPVAGPGSTGLAVGGKF